MMRYDRYLSPAGRQLTESAIRQMGTVVADATDLVSFAPGYPDASLFPWPELRAISAELLEGGDATALQYGPTRGYRPLLDAIRDLLSARNIRAAHEDLLVTSGSQQGIDLIARVLVGAGDVVLVELPTFTGAISAFKNVQADMVGVEQDTDGIRLDELDAAWERETRAGKRVKLLYVVPNFQNPTGALMSRERRRLLLEWAERRDVLIVEDDPYGALYFDDLATEADIRPLRADDEHGERVLYLSTFSKTLAPGFRVGWMTAPAPLIGRFETAKQASDLTSGVLDQRVVCEAVRRGVVERLGPALRAQYKHKRQVMEQALRAQLGDCLRWQTPKGGFFLWATVTTGATDAALLERALQQGVAFVVGRAFFVNGGGHDMIRLSFSAPSPALIKEGVTRLAHAFETLAS